MAIVACLRDQGLNAQAAEEPGSWTIDSVGHADEEISSAVARCRTALGEPNAYLSEPELRSRYEWRVEQHACLVDAGLASGSPKSFDAFVADYQRIGLAEWDPLEALNSHSFTAIGGALEACPRANSW